MEDQIFKPQSNKKWAPNKNHPTIEKCIEAIETELKQQGNVSDNKGCNSLSKGERLALKELSDCRDIIITKADKQGVVVIMDLEDYISETHCQLNIKDHHKKLNKDSTTTIAKLVNDIIQRFRKEKLLKDEMADGLKVSSPKNPKFYMQPKIHKKDNPFQD